MDDELRHSGIDVIGCVPWGTHFCQFFQTKQDLIDILVPYFKAGLENNEFCMWVTSEPLVVAEAQDAMRGAVNGFDEYLRKGQIEIIPYDEWYLPGGMFDDNRVLDGWVSKLARALARGYSGLRLTGNTFWLERNYWRAFTEYEAKVNNVIGRYRMMAICTYSLDKCDGAAVIDVVRNHQFALIKQEGKWDIIESTIYRQTKEALRLSEERYRSLFNNMTEAFALHEIILDEQGRPGDFRFIEVNEAFSRQTGLLPEKIIGKMAKEVLPGIEDCWIETYGKVALTGEAVSFEEFAASLGRWYEVYAYSPKKGHFATLFKDITRRKNVEKALRESEHGLRQAHELLEAVTKGTEVIIAAQDTSFRYTYFNHAYREEIKRLTGKDIHIGMSMVDAFSHMPDQKRVAVEEWSRALRGESTSKTLEFGDPRRHRRVYSVLHTPIWDAEGNVIGAGEVAFDVAERKKNEAEIAHLASFPELNPNPVLELDMAGNIKYMNPAARSYFPDIQAMDTRQQFLVDWENVVTNFHSGKSSAITRDIKVGDSWYEQSFVYMPSDDDVRVYIRDITTREIAKQALLESEKDLNRAQGVAHTGSWRLDVQGNELLWSNETHRIFGIPRGKPMTYETFLTSVLPEDRKYVDQKWAAALRAEPYDIEHRILVGNEVRWVRERAELELDSQGLLKGGFGTVQDITERKRAEETLAAAHAELDAIYANVPIPLMLVDRERRVRKVNLAAARFSLRQCEEMIGLRGGEALRCLRSLDDPKGCGFGPFCETCAVRRTVMDTFNTGKSQIEVEATFPVIEDGRAEERWLLISTALLRLNSMEMVLVCAQDITGRKRTENELRVKDYAVASAISGVAMGDLAGNVTYTNPSCLAMWDYENEDGMLGKHTTTFFANGSDAEMVLKAVHEEGAWQGELKAKRKDGSLFDTQVSANLVNDEEGKPICIMASFVDITETKRIQEALRREEQIRRTIIENAGAQLAYLDLAFSFIMVNSNFASAGGYDVEELIGKNYFKLFPSEENLAIFKQVRNTGESAIYYDKPIETKDRPERGITYWDWSLTPVKDFSGKVQGLVLSLIETTERKKVEELKDSFIGMVSHELRTPLTVINGCLSTVLTEWERLPIGESQQLLRDALMETETLYHLVENLLELSRFQAQQLTLYEQQTDVKTIIEETLNKVKRLAPSHQFIVSIPDGLLPINADPLRVERLLYNLLDNATKYSPAGSQVKVTAALDPERIVIGVSDQGSGLSLNEQARLFRPFQRLEKDGQYHVRGAGLGLVVCRRLVEAHGGEIWVKSNRGKGSTFFFSLPYTGNAGERKLGRKNLK
ncbi:MAG: hypothetical protein A2144_05520 [Chloroflexi bacterium RBG_16_50_9]|nr:MAG: hypothetical protein A2144_05520 [Chloroflexi bacterium RBG_16_50_9]